ncbi:MAG: tandem-95 repeat protein [Ardenticatenaceae bacterium]|nr:tandem-95 repeat protein [Ardenticatenaceae bacterium]MCB9445854.1 tandem-95 repeat protein [Ardenticatenaceae bacterium]
MRKSSSLNILLAFFLGVIPILALLWGLGGLPAAYAVTITVNTANDEYNEDGDCSLREAIMAANNDIAVDACGPGAGRDTIQFSLPTPAVITLTQGQLMVEKQGVTIAGPGDELLAISGNDTFRVFDVAAGIPITLSNLTVRNGRTVLDGGGLRAGGAVTLIDTNFTDNMAGDDGGAVDVLGNLTLIDTNILSNTAAGQGGGINSFGPATTLGGGLFQNNHAGDIAGGLYADKTLQIDGTQFTGNSAQNYAGAVWAWQSAVIQNSTFATNTTHNLDIGALYVRYNLALTDTMFISNTAHANGGAVLVGGDARILNGAFAGNAAETGCAGAVAVSGSMWVTNTHFIDNVAATNGGAVLLTGGDGRFLNTLLARNSASTGSAFYLAHSGGVAITHATIAGPEQAADNAIYINSSGTAVISHSIIGGYTTGIDVTAGNVSEDYTLFYDTFLTGGAVTSGGHSFEGDPAFIDPANNDYHLSASSEALNTGGDSGIVVDGDGDVRPGGGSVDIGCDETIYVSDVTIAKKVNATPLAGEPIVYTIAFTNTGTAQLPRLVLTDAIPAQVTAVHIISSGVALTGFAIDATYVWRAHSLAPGAGGVITVSGTLADPLPRGIFTNTVTIATIAVESDLSNNSASASLTVPNLAPVAVNDVLTIAEDTAVTLTPLANDIDGDPLHIVSFGQAALGTAVLSGIQQIAYTPTSNIFGTDTFTYTVGDDELTDSATITITITPVNDAPVITEGATVPITMSEDSSPTPFQLTLHAADVDNDPLTWSVTAQAVHGTAAAAAGPAVASIVTYTPAPNYAGPDSFVVNVTDGDLSDSITITLMLDPVNDTPMAVDDTAVALHSRLDGTIQLFAGGPDGSLNVLSNDGDIENSPLIVVDVSTGEYGGVVDLESDGRLFDYTLPGYFSGVERFLYTMSDGELADTAVISITVVNGLNGGMSGDTFAVSAIGQDSAFTVTTAVAAEGDDFTLIFDVPGMSDEVAVTALPTDLPPGFVPAGLEFSLAAFVAGRPLPDGTLLAEPITLTIDYSAANIANIGPSELSAGLYFNQVGSWTQDGIQIVERDTAQHKLAVVVDRVGDFALFRQGFVFLPLVTNNFVSAPDLVVESLVVLSSGGVDGSAGDFELVIRNVGTALVTAEFWVDVYVDPRVVPTAVNQTWSIVGTQGLVWGVTADVLPIKPGESLTLTLASATYKPDLSFVKWPLAANASIYAQVDSVGADNDTGAVLEIHEIRSEPYNNIFQMP